MIDIHTHILPGLDDGAEDVYDSLEMGAMAQEHGTKVIVATPHCNIPGLYSNYFGEHYKEVFLKTRKAFEREGECVLASIHTVNHISEGLFPDFPFKYATRPLPVCIYNSSVISSP